MSRVQTIEERKKYKKMLFKQLSSWMDEINRLDAKAKYFKKPTKPEQSRKVSILLRKVENVENQLQKLSEENDDKWRKDRKEAEKTLSEIRQSLVELYENLL
jgi:protein-tyrosine-phosphatase